jgi:hypothetical protein
MEIKYKHRDTGHKKQWLENLDRTLKTQPRGLHIKTNGRAEDTDVRKIR